MQSDDQVTNKIKEITKNYFSDADVLLFGSRVNETAKDKSDYDILIITNQLLTQAKKIPIRTQIRQDLLKFGVRSDILIQSRAEVEIKKNLPGHIIRNIMRNAILL